MTHPRSSSIFERPLSRADECRRLRADGGENREPTGDDVLATIESAEIRTYDSAEAVPRWVPDEETVASPADFDLDVSVDVVTETATVRRPARISVRIGYFGEEPLSYTGSSVPNLDSTTGLHLYYTDTTIEREDDGCWSVRPLGTDLSLLFTAFEPNESHEVEFDVVGDSTKGVCYPVGEYELAQRINVSIEDTAIYWGLRIELS